MEIVKHDGVIGSCIKMTSKIPLKNGGNVEHTTIIDANHITYMSNLIQDLLKKLIKLDPEHEDEYASKYTEFANVMINLSSMMNDIINATGEFAENE